MLVSALTLRDLFKGVLASGSIAALGNGFFNALGTCRACEENFNGYFSASDQAHEVSPELKRYGVSSEDWGYGWARVDDRVGVSKNSKVPNRAGNDAR